MGLFGSPAKGQYEKNRNAANKNVSTGPKELVKYKASFFGWSKTTYKKAITDNYDLNKDQLFLVHLAYRFHLTFGENCLVYVADDQMQCGRNSMH